jgi:hypothetical protein
MTAADANHHRCLNCSQIYLRPGNALDPSVESRRIATCGEDGGGGGGYNLQEKGAIAGKRKRFELG